MQDYLDATWQTALQRNGLDSFDKLWACDAQWFEEPNRRRNGWSGVARCELTWPDGEKRAYFLKRQENHNTFSWLHPLRGIPTFVREFRHIRRYRACEVPTLQPVYFATRNQEGNARAILITAELTGYVALDAWLASALPPLALRRACIRSVADLLHGMHRHGIQHNCFFPKHVFVRATGDNRIEARVIDLEKSRWRPLAITCALRDIDTLNRHSQEWSRTDRLRFLMAYLGIEHTNAFAKWLWQRLVARQKRKSKVK
jgi:hypothetical protein